jgi:outer membrane protein
MAPAAGDDDLSTSAETRMYRRTAFVLLLGFAALLAARGQEAAPVITLQEAVDGALARGDSNKILQATLGVSRAQYAATAASGSFTLAGTLGYAMGFPVYNTLPAGSTSVTLGGSAAATEGPQAGLTLSGPLTSVSLTAYPYVPPSGAGAATASVGLSVSQTLWDGYPGGQVRATIEKSLLGLQVTELSTQAAVLNLIYSVKQAYFAMLAAQENLPILQEILDRQNALLKQITATYELKQATTVDLQSAQISVQSAQINLESGQQVLRIARIQLANLIGHPIDQEFSVAQAAEPQVPALSLQDAVTEALGRRTDIRQVELNRKILAVELALIRGQRTPTVEVSGAVDWTFGWAAGSAGAASLGGKLGLPLLDAGAAGYQEQANRQQDQVYAAQESQLGRSITAAIEDAYLGMQVQQHFLEVARLSVQSYQLQFDLEKLQFANGTATAQDLLDASVNLANAQFALATARSNLQLAVLKLQNVMGY